ncbi:hypothetical protein [Cyanothece sp. BG0011]|uniref:hypothetical protein n=1 Tax=Cyanothece sp. BG0011 TaxID=2082950 RepID=UPI000D1FCE49|nr:hypothetical protein [Cyanothece sp. BG0011]
MTKRYLSLVLVEIPDDVEDNPYVHWFNCVSISQAKLRDGMLELVYCDGTIKVFNTEETEEILEDCGELLNKFLWEKDFTSS